MKVHVQSVGALDADIWVVDHIGWRSSGMGLPSVFMGIGVESTFTSA